jgi:outer membrane protein
VKRGFTVNAMKAIRSGIAVITLACVCTAFAQQGQQPPPFTAPSSPLPAAPAAPGQQQQPSQQQTPVPPEAPLPHTDETTVDLRDLPRLSAEPARPAGASPDVDRASNVNALPDREKPSPFHDHIYNLIGAYQPPHVPNIPAGGNDHISNLMRDGKLYLSLHDAIELAIENNLDVEISRYDLLLADTDTTRARGGGSLRGIDYTVTQTAPGVAAATSPLLITQTTGQTAPTSTNVIDLSQVQQIGNSTQTSLGENNSATFSQGPQVPLYDPTFSGQAGYFRRSDQTSLETSTSGPTTSTSAKDYVAAGLDYQQGFSFGTQLEVFADNASQALYGGNSQLNPAHAPSTSLTITQPLLRGAGRRVNVRYIRIAQLNQKVSRLVFEQQLLETIYGISRLYYDLVSLGENIGVQEEALAAAQRLYSDDDNQVKQGTLAPIELTRAQALVSSTRLNLIQAQGQYRQQEVILREQLLRSLGDAAANFATIIPTDNISVPNDEPALDVPSLIQDALSNRPDLAQAALQVRADVIQSQAARNAVRPELNAYANVQTRGYFLAPYMVPGSPGTGAVTVPPELTQGGLTLSTIYQGGVQLSLPLRNRIAQADAARDSIQLRQAQGRTAKLENDVRQQIENAAIALDTAHQAYAAAVESSNYQQQLLQAELDKFSVGESTNFLIIQDEAYLAQARSTEVAARSDWMKARISLDRALGNLLDKNHISLEDAVRNANH